MAKKPLRVGFSTKKKKKRRRRDSTDWLLSSSRIPFEISAIVLVFVSTAAMVSRNSPLSAAQLLWAGLIIIAVFGLGRAILPKALDDNFE